MPVSCVIISSICNSMRAAGTAFVLIPLCTITQNRNRFCGSACTIWGLFTWHCVDGCQTWIMTMEEIDPFCAGEEAAPGGLC